MEKIKLKEIRLKKGLSQQEVAILSHMDQATYGRKENGVSKITSNEWKRFALVLDVPLSEIFEAEDRSVVISNDNSPNSKVMANSSDYCNMSEYVLESLKKYIEKLEAEIKYKEEEIVMLRSKVQKES